MRNLKHTLTVAALGVASFFSAASAEPLDPAQVPGESKWVVHVDMDALKKSTTWKELYDRAQKRPEFMAKVTELEQIFNARFPDDLRGITLFGANFGDRTGVVLIDANVDRKQVEGLLAQSPKATSTPRGDHAMLSWDDKGQTKHGVFFSDSKFLIGDDKESVALALDVLDGKGKALKADASLAAGAETKATPGILIYIAGEELGKLRQAAARSPLLAQTKNAWFSLVEDKEQLIFKLSVTADTAQAAADVLKAGEGLRAMLGLMATAENAKPGLIKLNEIAQKASLTNTGTTVTLEAKLPQNQLPAVIDEAMKRK